MKTENTDNVTGLEASRFRILWWHHTTFGRPSLTRRFYGGSTTVFTWGRIWIEWLPFSEEGTAFDLEID